MTSKKKNQVVHTMVSSHIACVFNGNNVSHQRRHYKAGNVSLHSRSLQWQICIPTLQRLLDSIIPPKHPSGREPAESACSSGHNTQTLTQVVCVLRAVRGCVEYHFSEGCCVSCTSLRDQMCRSCFVFLFFMK